MYDVIVIGGGVVGGILLRELTKYQLSCCLLEKESDVCMGQSRANSGIVHAGFDAAVGSLKAKFNVEGCSMMPALANELGVTYRKIGSLVVAFSKEEENILQSLLERGIQNGVKELEIITGEKLKALEPNLSPKATAALYAPTAGIICPYGLTIAAIGNAMDNGAALKYNFEVASVHPVEGGYELVATNKDRASAKVVINCAGLGSGKIASLVGDTYVHVGGRRGEYILLDKESGSHARHTLFFTPTEKGKGILVSPTADGNLLLGPTAEEVEDGSVSTTAAMLRLVEEKAKELCPGVPLGNAITSFAGVRAYCDRHDFIIEESRSAKGFIHCAGVESPGLTASPAIAKYVVETLVAKRLPLTRNEKFSGRRRPIHAFRDMSAEEKNALIAREPSYGRIVCRCEKITEGEIVHAIHTNPPARTLDAVKRRTRAGMGRCQGGFCQPQVTEILARELNIPLNEVQKSGSGSELLVGRSK